MPEKKKRKSHRRVVKARSAGSQQEPFEGKTIGRTNTPFLGSKQ